MKDKYILGVVGWLFLLLFNQSVYSQKKDCGQSCFHSEIIDTLPEGNCTTYKIQITAGSDCVHGLSHYSVGIPPCYELSEVSNSENWKIEYGTDPTTGVSGFKIDDINNFGDDNQSKEFFVSFTVCDTGCDELGCWAPEVAYKAGICVYYDQVELVCANLEAHLVKSDAKCANEPSGSLEVVVDDGVAPYTYQWTNGSTEAVNSNIIAGTYSVTITDANGSVLELMEEIMAPSAIEISTETINATCSGQSDGAITTVISGGTAPYSILWSNGATSQDVEAIAGGYYSLQVTDTNGCVATASAIVNNTVFISITGTVTNAGCNLDNGAIDINVSGGMAPYTFSWSNESTEEDISELLPGSYRVIVTDANGCFSTRTFGVSRDNPLRLSSITTPTACIENYSGTIDLTVNGGALPYLYEWSNGATTEDIDSLAAGTYIVKVTDANGCYSSLNVNISSATFQASGSVNQISCNGEADGSISLTVNGGTPPYSYVWSNGTEDSEVMDLTTGSYSVEISDATGCTKTLSYFIIEPTPIQLSFVISNPSCEETGYQIDLTTTGGSNPFTFVWSNGQTTEDIIGLLEGTYEVLVTDSKGCTAVGEVIVIKANTDCPDDDGGGDNGDGDGDGDDGDGDGGGDDGGDHGGGNGNGHDWDLNCDNPFDTTLELVSVEGNCYTYSATVTYDGAHVHGLSHMSIDVDCGNLEEVTNSEHWSIEYGTDPTTGLSGFKIDDVNNFGEGDIADYFDFSFTICSEDQECLETLVDANFEVAYKYGQCITYQNVDGISNLSEQMTVATYPNPSKGESKIRVYTPIATNVTVDIYNRNGLLVKRIYNKVVQGHQDVEILFDGYDLPSDIYTYKITTDYGVKYGKLILAKQL